MGRGGGTAESPGSHTPKSSSRGRRRQKSCRGPGFCLSLLSLFLYTNNCDGPRSLFTVKGVLCRAVGMEAKGQTLRKERIQCQMEWRKGKGQGQLAREIGEQFPSPPPTLEEWRRRGREQVLARDEEVAFGQVFEVRQDACPWVRTQDPQRDSDGPEGQ